MSSEIENIKVLAYCATSLDYHRLNKYTTYPNRQKQYKTQESFKEILQKLAKQKLIYPFI